jgi:hypothetical protein
MHHQSQEKKDSLLTKTIVEKFGVKEVERFSEAPNLSSVHDPAEVMSSPTL